MKEQIRALIQEGGDFEKCALDLYRWQRAHNPEYDRFCGPITVRHWSEIPAVPTSLFRDLSFTSFPIQQATVVFRTSGTTSGKRGNIHLVDTDIYNLAAKAHAENCLHNIPKHGVSFVSTAEDSSLGHMCRHFVPAMPNFFDAQSGVRTEAAWNAITEAAQLGQPLFLPGTAFALADLLDAEHPPIHLPPGSIVMVTGGFKGKRRSVPSTVLHNQLARRLPGAQVVSEYGMSELSSQLWAVPAESPFRPPPWMRVLAVDPWTGEPATRGLLRFFDLANYQTVVAIETADMGVVYPDGSVSLEGRLEGATPRGCSLTVEEAGV